MKKEERAFSHVAAGTGGRLKALGARLRCHIWFPHVPLALAVFMLGVLHISRAPIHELGWAIFSKDLKALADSIIALQVDKLPKMVPALFLMVMSVGVLLRSQFAWIVTILFIGASIVIDIFTFTAHSNWGLLVCDVAVLAPLIYFRHYFQKRSVASASLFAVTSLVVIMGYAVIGAIKFGGEFSPPIRDFVTALYFAVETMSTVGYGDITPMTDHARLFAISVIVLGITIFATALSAVILPVFNSRIKRLLQKGEHPMERSGHYVIVGDSALSRNSYKAFRDKGQEVTMILPAMPEQSVFADDDLLVGDGSDLDTLKKAYAQDSAAVLALGDNDADNAFVVLAAKELTGKPRTVACVSDSKNLKRVHQVKPDLVISPQILGSRVLALALLGDSAKGEALMEDLFQKVT